MKLVDHTLEFDRADRMAKALRRSGISSRDIARELSVSVRSVSNWINGHIEPSRATLIAWAQITDVDFNWLQTGELPHAPGNDEGPAPVGTGPVSLVRPEGFEPPTFCSGVSAWGLAA